jgi:hypothetical protein
MKPRKPISIVRPLVPAAGRIRAVRVALVPMIWRRRRRRGGAVSILRAAQPGTAPAPVNVSVRLNLVWPPCPPAAIAPATMFERVIRQIFGVVRDGPRIETNRLLRLVETLSRTGPGAASLPPPPPSRPPRSTVSGLDGGAAPLRPRLRLRTVADTASPGSATWALRPGRRTAVRADLARRETVSSIAARPAPPRSPRAPAEPAMVPPPARALRIAFRCPSRAALAPSPNESTARPPRPEAGPVAMIWRKTGRAGPRFAVALSEPFLAGSAARPSWKPRTALVWRDSPPDEDGRGTAARVNRSIPASSPGPAVFPVAPPMSATPAAAPAPAQGPDMGRLVDEVVRRLERIGRDERLRRGL